MKVINISCTMMFIQYIPRNMHMVFALLCFVVVIHWLIFPYPSGLLHWHCGNLTIAPVPAKQPWWTWLNTSCEFIMNDCITTTKQSTTKPCAYFLGYTVTISPVSEKFLKSRGRFPLTRWYINIPTTYSFISVTINILFAYVLNISSGFGQNCNFVFFWQMFFNCTFSLRLCGGTKDKIESFSVQSLWMAWNSTCWCILTTFRTD